jgi:hypothetical protein
MLACGVPKIFRQYAHCARSGIPASRREYRCRLAIMTRYNASPCYWRRVFYLHGIDARRCARARVKAVACSRSFVPFDETRGSRAGKICRRNLKSANTLLVSHRRFPVCYHPCRSTENFRRGTCPATCGIRGSMLAEELHARKCTRLASRNAKASIAR